MCVSANLFVCLSVCVCACVCVLILSIGLQYNIGVGMTSEQLGSLFSEGVQFDANQLQAGQGSGLGLFIAKGIVNLHGGRITAHSKGKGEGTEFEVELPLFARKDNAVMQLNIKPRGWFAGGVSGSSASISPTVVYDTTDKMLEYDKKPSATPSRCSRRILIVDDSSTNRKLMNRMLTSSCGHVCVEAVDGQGNETCSSSSLPFSDTRTHTYAYTHGDALI